ncbi:MAG: Crp/Fnr family transcriptional regulator [Polyangiales bacterium]
MVPDIPRLVARIPLFSGLDPKDLAQVGSIASTKLFKANERVVRQGDAAEAAYVVVHGRLKVSVEGDAARGALLGLMGPGEVFGELSIVDGGTRSATVHAIEPTLLVVIERARFESLIKSSADVAYKVLKNISRRLRRLTERVEVESTLDVERRLARRIIELAATEGVQEGKSIRVRVKLSQSDLGEMIGATRESVNKHLRALAARKIVDHGRGEIVVHDLRTLRAIARGDVNGVTAAPKKTAKTRK